MHLFLEQPLFPNICSVGFHRFPIDDVEVMDAFSRSIVGWAMGHSKAVKTEFQGWSFE